MTSITDIFIKRPVLAIVVNLILLAVGWRCVSALPIRQYPRIESTKIIINTVYIGASAETVRGFLTTPIEQAVAAIDGIDYIESASTPGMSMITVHLRLNHDKQRRARRDHCPTQPGAQRTAARGRIADHRDPAHRPPLRHVLHQLHLRRRSRSRDSTTTSPARSSPNSQRSPGRAAGGIEGPRNLAMRIWLEFGALTASTSPPSRSDDALQRNNFVAAVGRTKGDDVQIDLMTDTDLRSPEEFRNLVVREREGTIVRLADVARIDLESEEATGQAGFNGKPAIWFSVWPLPSANELEVAAVLKAKLKELQPTLPPGVEMVLAYDGTYYMDNAIKEITKTLGETIGIVALVVFLFMGSTRTVLVPLVAMPVSLVGACVFDG